MARHSNHDIKLIKNDFGGHVIEATKKEFRDICEHPSRNNTIETDNQE